MQLWKSSLLYIFFPNCAPILLVSLQTAFPLLNRSRMASYELIHFLESGV